MLALSVFDNYMESRKMTQIPQKFEDGTPNFQAILGIVWCMYICIYVDVYVCNPLLFSYHNRIEAWICDYKINGLNACDSTIYLLPFKIFDNKVNFTDTCKHTHSLSKHIW